MTEKERKGSDHTWKEFHDLFLRYYFPPSVHERKKKEFLYLTQGTRSVLDYKHEFNRLSRFARGLVVTEQDKVDKFVGGLKMTLQKDVSMFEVTTFAAAVNKALKTE